MKKGNKKGKSGSEKNKSHKSFRAVDTYQAWLEKQRKRRKPAATERKPAEVRRMPVDTMEEWLRKQPVVEREKKEVTPPISSTEEWLRKQVSSRLSKDREELEETKAISESLPSADSS